jgi:hypothetical protein
MSHESPTDVTVLQADILDHASEFVALVCQNAPEHYRAMLRKDHFRKLLQQENAFNHGKLFTYAEYRVFRAEFLHRFPTASPHACISAFSKLFLKNDISITNLVNALETGLSTDLLYLQGKRSPAEDTDI